MRLERFDLNLLVALNTLLAERSVSAAAERLNLTPSAMSHTLARLRQQFNDELLIQTGRKLMLTARAEALVVPLRETLLRIEQLIADTPSFDPASCTRCIRILASDYALSVILAAAIPRMKATAAHMVFEVLQIDDPVSQLTQGDVDLLVAPQQFLAPEHPFARLFDDEYVLVMWSGSTLAQEDITEDRYFSLGHAAVILPRGSLDAQGITVATARARRIELTTQSFTLLPSLLIGTDLVATLPKRQADIAVRMLPLVIRPLPFATPRIRECVQWHRLRDGDPAMAWVVANLQASADSEASADFQANTGCQANAG